MKNECDIVGDLLFSYNDGVLSNASKELVEEHLKNCEKCNEMLKEIKKENDEKSQVKEIDFLKNIKKRINKRNIIISVVSIIFLVLVVFNIQVYNNYKEVASTMEIFLKDDVTEQQIEDIKNKIMEKSKNLEYEYISKEEALEKMKSKFKEDGVLLEGYNNQENPFPASIQIKADIKSIEEIVKAIQNDSGIRYITTNIKANPYELYMGKLMEI